jgi:hypothetical protein
VCLCDDLACKNAREILKDGTQVLVCLCLGQMQHHSLSRGYLFAQISPLISACIAFCTTSKRNLAEEQFLSTTRKEKSEQVPIDYACWSVTAKLSMII